MGGGCPYQREDTKRAIGLSLKRFYILHPERASGLGRQQSLEERERKRNKLKGRTWTEEQNLKRRKTLLGHTVSEETRKKMSLKNANPYKCALGWKTRKERYGPAGRKGKVYHSLERS